MDSFSHIYKRLFELSIYHNYFLDDGQVAFDNNAILKEEQLEKYDFQDYIDIMPSKASQKTITNQKIVVKTTPSGLTLFIKAKETAPNSGIFAPAIDLSQDIQLTLLLYVSDYIFENYSTVPAVPDIPFLFTNLKPSTEGAGFEYIDLESTTTNIEDFTMTQATYDDLALQLTSAEKIGLFGILQLEMEGDDTIPVDGNARNVLESNGDLKTNHINYKIQIKNRSTVWNYRNASDGGLIHTSDPTELPLVKNGIVGYTFDTEERPSAEPTRLIFEKDGGGNIIKTISEIYIN